MVALRVSGLVNRPSRFAVEMRELNDVELGHFFSQCKAVIGVRLHSAIIAMNFGTPAFVVPYEHKSTGTMERLGLSHRVLSLRSILNGSAAEYVLTSLSGIASTRAQLKLIVDRERARAEEMVHECLASLPKDD